MIFNNRSNTIIAALIAVTVSAINFMVLIKYIISESYPCAAPVRFYFNREAKVVSWCSFLSKAYRVNLTRGIVILFECSPQQIALSL